MNWNDFTATPQYTALTPGQRVWTAAFAASHDMIWATRMGFRVSEQNLYCRAFKIRRAEDIRAALAVLEVGDTREEFLFGLEKQYRSAKAGSESATQLAILIAKFRFGIDESTGTPKAIEAGNDLETARQRYEAARMNFWRVRKRLGVIESPRAKVVVDSNPEQVSLPAKPAPVEHRFSVGDLVRQNGIRYRVSEIDSDGRIVDAVEAE